MQMIRAENTRNCLRSFQGCCDKTQKMIKTHRYVLAFENTHNYGNVQHYSKSSNGTFVVLVGVPY